MRILVTGATGYIGGRLVPELLKKHYTVRCLARDPKKLSESILEKTETFAGDVFDTASLAAALKDVRVAFYLIHSMTAGGTVFAKKDRLAAANFAQAAADAGLQKIIYLGGLGSDHVRLSEHLASRHEVGAILKESGIPVTELRAAVIIGAGSLSFKMIRYLTERLPVMICPKWIRSRCQPVAVRDVLSYLTTAVENKESDGKILEIGGADILSYGEMILGYAEVRGLKRWLIPVPVLTPRLSSYWIDWVTPIPASLSRALIEGLRNDVICRDKSALRIFPFRPMGYKAALWEALSQQEGE